MLLPILQYPDPRLFVPGKTVEVVDAQVKKIVTDMFETHYAQENCAALAATQLGIGLRITVIDFSEEKDQPLCLINPVITERSEATTYLEEGCMSVYGVSSKVRRSERITLTYLDAQGKSCEMRDVDGFMAKCIQHELDHLDGVLFLDKLPSSKRAIVLQKLARTARRGS